MSKKIISSFIILFSVFMYSCGFSPMYSMKDSQNLNIEVMSAEGDREINLNLKSKLRIHKNPNSQLFRIVINSNYLKNTRRYVVVIIFTVAAILTPPDPITQIGLAIPLLLLYELSIITVKFTEKKDKNNKN